MLQRFVPLTPPRLTLGIGVTKWPTTKLAGTLTAATTRNFTSGGAGSPRAAADSSRTGRTASTG